MKLVAKTTLREEDDVRQNQLRTEYQSGVPRDLVHRVGISEVFLTASERTGPHRHQLAAQWPRRHFYYDLEAGNIDALLVAETLRQATIFLGHSAYGIPLGHGFLMNTMSVQIHRSQLEQTATPSEIVLVADVDQIKTGKSGIASSRTRIQFLAAGLPLASGAGCLQVVDPRVLARMRNGAVISTDPRFAQDSRELRSVAGHSGVAIVPVAGVIQSWALRADVTHPSLFDHPVDHLPGMLLMEAARQAARKAAGWPAAKLTSFEGSFSSFLELDQPSVMRLEAMKLSRTGTEAQIRLTVHQGDSFAADMVVELHQ